MKKFIYTCIFSIGALTLVGCGNQKTLECTHTTNTSDYGTQQETYKVTFKDNKLNKQVVTTKITLSEAMLQYKEDFFTSIKSGMEEANNKNGIKTETSLKDNIIETKMTVTIKDLDVESKNYIGLDDTQTYDALKQNLTNNGYTCK